MSIVPYIERPPSAPLDPTIALLGKPEGAVLDFVSGKAWIVDKKNPANTLFKDINDVVVNASPSNKWIKNKAGILESGNRLRCEYDAMGNPLGLRVEQQQPNLLRNSRFLLANNTTAPANWAYPSINTGTQTVGASAVTGGQSVMLMAESGRQFIRQNVDLAANTTYCFSSFAVVAGTSNAIDSYIQPTNLPVGATLEYLLNEVIVPAATLVPVGANVIAARVIVGATAGPSVLLNIGMGVNKIVSGSIVLDRPQCEPGTYRTSDIPTGMNETVTRAADNLTVLPSRLPMNDVDAGNTIIFDYICYRSGYNTTLIHGPAVTQMSAPFRIVAALYASATFITQLPATTRGFPAGAPPLGQPNKVAYAYKNGEQKRAVNGVVAYPSGGAGAPIEAGNTQRLVIGGITNGGNNYDHSIKRIVIIPGILADAELQTRTM